MSIVESVRNIFSNLFNLTKENIKDTKNKIILLRTNNYYIAMSFFNQGDIKECIRRLKISLKLWPEDDDFKYLLSLSYIIYRDCQKALLILNTINKDYKSDIVEKLMFLAERNKTKKIIDLYIETGFNIVLIEDEIKNMDI